MKYKIFLPVIILALSISLAYSMEVYVRPARIVARMNVTPGETSTYTGFLEVKNQNNFTVNVTISPQGVLVGKVDLAEELVVLEPGESKNIDFTINVDQPGNYQGTIVVTYLVENTPGVGLQADIIVIATEVEGEQKPISGFLVLNNTLKYGIIGFIVLLIIIILLVLRGGVKVEK